MNFREPRRILSVSRARLAMLARVRVDRLAANEDAGLELTSGEQRQIRYALRKEAARLQALFRSTLKKSAA